jgi:hypothetical protein
LTQGFGPSAMGVEPAMYADSRRAWWQPFAGAKYHPHFHAALDLAAPSGTVIRASEDGTVIESLFDRTNGGGNKVRVQVRPGVSYCHNHMASRAVALGAYVTRGQKIGTVGSTGWSTGPHSHFWIGFDDEVGSNTWPTLVNPALFLPGGALANDPRILPLRRFVQVNGPGVNVRTSADLDQAANIFATAREDGIYRRDRRISALTYRFAYVKRITTDDGQFYRVTGYRRTLYLHTDVAHLV